jgi:hypothetical protein
MELSICLFGLKFDAGCFGAAVSFLPDDIAGKDIRVLENHRITSTFSTNQCSAQEAIS